MGETVDEQITGNKRVPWNKGKTGGKGRKHSEETKRKISEAHKGIYPSEETRKKLSLSHKGKVPTRPFKKGNVPWNKGKKMDEAYRKQVSDTNKRLWSDPEHREKMSNAHKGKTTSDEHKRLMTERWTGSGNPNWRGGSSNFRAVFCGTAAYKSWRTAVFERDNYTCQMCDRRGGYLEVDHIKPFAVFPDLRLELDNGRVLCRPCHKTTDTFGTKALRFKDHTAEAKIIAASEPTITFDKA